MLYAIQAGEDGPIKLGEGTDPRHRLRVLQTGNASDLRVLAIWPGHRRQELELHERFAAARVRGEWFAPTPEVTAFVAARAAENHPLEGTPLRELFGPQDAQAFAIAARLPPSRAVRVDGAMEYLTTRVPRRPNPVDVGRALVALLESSGLTQEELAERVGKSQEWISNSIRLLRLPEPLLTLIAEGQLRRAHGLALLGECDALRRIDLGCRAALERWTVRRLLQELDNAACHH